MLRTLQIFFCAENVCVKKCGGMCLVEVFSSCESTAEITRTKMPYMTASSLAQAKHNCPEPCPTEAPEKVRAAAALFSPPRALPTLLSLAACQLCGSKFEAMQGDGGRGKRQQAQAKADAQAKAAVEAEAEANAKSNGRDKGGHDFLSTF